MAANSRPNADRLRLFTVESIAVHKQYRSDGESLRQFRHFINWQVAYLLPENALQAMHYPAHTAGFGAMQDFLEKGYTTFHAIDDANYFLGQFAGRITAVFTRLCEQPLADLDPIPVRRRV